MKKILVPTDFSIYAENALKIAAQLAKKHNAEIFLLHMLELPNQMSDAISSGKSIPEVMFFIQKAKEIFSDIFDRPYLDGIEVTEFIQFEKASKGVHQFIKKNDVDLIVMGSHGTSGESETYIGPTTEKVVRISEIPVLIVTKEDNDFQLNEVVFASDFSNESKSSLQKMKDLTSKWNAKINLVTVCTPNNFKPTDVAIAAMEAFANEFELTNFSISIYNELKIETGILNFANKVNADLIGVCTPGRTGLSHFFNGGITEGIVNHTQKPVLAFKL